MTGHTYLSRLHAGELLISDGATGTNLQARGLPRGSPTEAWIFDQPDEIIRLHQDFITAGADIILTCTFGATSLRLKGSELESQVGETNRRAVALARQAIDKAPVLVGGSMGPLGQLLKPFGPLENDVALNAYREQALALSDAGADLLVIETQFDLKEACIAVEAARSVCTLPLVCSFSFDRGKRTMMGVTPEQAGRELDSTGVDVIGINCGRSLVENLQALTELRQITDKPIWFKPNAGLPQVDRQGSTIYIISPEELGAQVSSWINAGAQTIGGCCGTSPQHLGQIALAVRQVKQD